MKFTDEEFYSPRIIMNSDQFNRIKKYIELWKRTHGICGYRDGQCLYCLKNRAKINKNIDVTVENNRVRLDITVRRKGWFGLYYKHYEIVYQEDDGPWWSDFWIDIDMSEREILEELKKMNEKYQKKLFQFAVEYIHNKYDR